MVVSTKLAEFSDDEDRLDVMALDEDGKILPIELKVDESLGVTDLQALAFAGAYASPAASLRRDAYGIAPLGAWAGSEQGATRWAWLPRHYELTNAQQSRDHFIGTSWRVLAANCDNYV